jgi:hypothetical protein|tara:strand:- start:297 stop:956 length:660 start_codon:yes stop_codon:yes gene_type:complete
MNKEKFVDSYLDKLLDDKDIGVYMDGADTDRERELLKGKLKDSLSSSYDSYARNYFDSKGIGSYVSTFLRYTGAGADALGTYMFWALGGAGFGLKGVGLLEKSVADVMDEAHYLKHAETDSLTEKVTDSVKIAGEGVAERVAAYLPLGVGELADLMRGKSKFDGKIVSRAEEYAKNNFIDYVSGLDRSGGVESRGPKVIPLDNFRNPEYSRSEDQSVAA